MSIDLATRRPPAATVLSNAQLEKTSDKETVTSKLQAEKPKVAMHALALGADVNPIALADRMRQDLAHNGIDELLVKNDDGYYLVWGTELAGKPREGDVLTSAELSGKILMAQLERPDQDVLLKWAVGLLAFGVLTSTGLGWLFPALPEAIAPGALIAGGGSALGLHACVNARPAPDLKSLSSFVGSLTIDPP